MNTQDTHVGNQTEQFQWERLRFHGEGKEYFKIWIVNIFLSIITLGIYSAWAKVRTNRYFYGNTELAEATFDYHATPMMILKGRIIAVGVLVAIAIAGNFFPLVEVISFALIFLIAPWVIWRSLMFNARMSSYRNVRFDFVGKARTLYKYLFLLPLLPFIVAAIIFGLFQITGDEDIVSTFADSQYGELGAGLSKFSIVIAIAIIAFYLLIPFIQKCIVQYYLTGHRYGESRFEAKLETSAYYVIYMKFILLGFLIFIALGIFAFIISQLFGGFGQFAQLPPNQGSSGMFSFLFMAPLIMLWIAVIIWTKSYLTCRMRNYTFKQLRLAKAADIRSKLVVNELFSIQFTNILLLIVTAGLAYPWTIVRLTKYKLQTIEVCIETDIDKFVSQLQARQSALGDEIGEAFDIDLNLGI